MRLLAKLSILVVAVITNIPANAETNPSLAPSYRMNLSITMQPYEIVVPLSRALKTGETKLLVKWLTADVLVDLKNKVGDGLISQSILTAGNLVGITSASRSDIGATIRITANTAHTNGSVVWDIVIDKNQNRIVSLNFAANDGRKNASSQPAGTQGAGGSRQSSGGLRVDQSYVPSYPSGSPAPSSGGLNNNKNARPHPPASAPASGDGEIEFDLDRYGWDATDLEIKPDPPLEQIQILFATTRKHNNSTKDAIFTADRSNALTFGVARIGIPRDHKIGEIERPATWSFFGFNLTTLPEDDKLHFSTKSVVIKSRADAISLLKDIASDEALIFVHGYNNTFEASLYRTAQIAWDLQYRGVPLMFSWPSQGTLTGYFYDRDSAYGSRTAFIDFLKMLRNEAGIKKVNILAHSMGNLLVLDALSNYAQTTDPVNISRLIMAAPDVDRDQFLQFVPSIAKITSGLTLYASSKDKALVASKTMAQAPRAGDLVLGVPITMPGLESIDVSILGDEIFGLNHNVFATSKSILGDIRLLLNGVPPPRVIDIRGSPEGIRPPAYWRYVP